MNEQKPRIIFWGTPEFALPSLEELLRHHYIITAVVTAPDEPQGKKQALILPPVKRFAQKHHIPVYQPVSMKTGDWKSRLPPADLFVVASYGKIIPKDILELPRLGALNIHPSLLPRWRGPSPIQSALLQGETETGVTIIKMDELMDHGPIVAKEKVKSQSAKVTFRELHDDLAEMGAALLIEILPRWLCGGITPAPQDESAVTYSKIFKKEDGRIDWSKPARQIERMVRALNPWPGAWTTWASGQKIIRLRIEEACVSDTMLSESPGFVGKYENGTLWVKTGEGSLGIVRLTPEGKKSMEAAAFVRGHPEIISTKLL